MPSSSEPSSSPSTPPQASPTRGTRLLRRHHEGALIFGERRADVRFIIEPAEGRLVLPIEPVALEAEHWVVIAPDEADRRMEVLLEPREIERPEAEACVDRWRAYFGEAPSKRWASCHVLGLRGWFDGRAGGEEPEVFDTEALAPASTLAACEGRLLKRINGQRERLRAVCRRGVGGASVDVAEPLCVGVDQFGLDVRARFGVVRVEFSNEARDEADATRMIESLLHAE